MPGLRTIRSRLFGAARFATVEGGQWTCGKQRTLRAKQRTGAEPQRTASSTA
ncbi:unnamed protein product, partial [Closterium sp. Naga37s-1]